MVHSVAPVAASAVGFGGLHVALRHGACYHRFEQMYANRKERGLLSPQAQPSTLASQAQFRVLNEIHNLLAVPLAIALMFDPGLNSDTVHGSSGLARMVVLLSAGYFLVDGAVVVRNFKEHGPEPLIHAIICSTFFVYCAVKRKLLYYAPRLLFFELSTPFVHVRWFLHSIGLQKSKLYKVNGIAMVGSFFVCRILWGTKLIRTFLTTVHEYRKNPRCVADPMGRTATQAVSLMCCGMTALNCFWFYKMLRGCFKVFIKKQSA
eukprot:jgi/Ulvmu1/3099/UM015_0139.1